MLSKTKYMSVKRKIVQVDTPVAEPGFLGAGHMARPVIRRSFAESDPFIMLMDDMLDKKDNKPVGGPHPHAGFETVTLIIEGELGDDVHKMEAGDFQLMTAGKGVVHTETIDKPLKMRILQLWLTLPGKDRWATPRLQDIAYDNVPGISENDTSIKLYSGSLAGLTSPVQNHTPLIVADVTMKDGATTALQIPASFNTFMYVLSGSVKAGAGQKLLQQDQVGWLDIFGDDTPTELELTAGENGTRFILYAGKPTGDAIVPYGPFIADTKQDIVRLYHEYNTGQMPHITTVPQAQRIIHGK